MGKSHRLQGESQGGKYTEREIKSEQQPSALVQFKPLRVDHISKRLTSLRQQKIPTVNLRTDLITANTNSYHGFELKREKTIWKCADPNWNYRSEPTNLSFPSGKDYHQGLLLKPIIRRQVAFLKPEGEDYHLKGSRPPHWKLSSSTLSRKYKSDTSLSTVQRSFSQVPLLQRLGRYETYVIGAHLRRSTTHDYKLCDSDCLDIGDVSDRSDSDEDDVETPPPVGPEPIVRPILRFKHAVKTVIVLLKATKHSGRQLPDSRLLSFTQYQDEIARTRPSVFGQDLAFDPLEFKAHKEIHLSNEAKTILSMEPRVRTAEQLHVALLSLQQTAEAFSEFPVKMQKSLARVGWYEHFESKRVIIRQGHTAENFYLILSGTAVVTILESGGKSREPFMRTAALLRKGHSFGELALMHGATRSATVTCKEDVELLAVGRDDFIDIFMPVVNDKVPEHIRFLQEVDVLKGWPTDKLPRGKPQICLITYFRRGVVMCRDSSDDEWVYFIKSGSCSVLKSLTSTTPDIPGLQQQSYLPIMNSPTLRPRGLVCRAGRGHSNSSPYSSSNSHTSSTDLHRDLQVDLPSDLRRDPLLAEERITPNARSNKAPHPSHLPPIPRRPKQPVNVVIGEDRKVNNNTNSSPSNHRKVNNNTNSSPSNHRKVNNNTNSSPSNHSGNMADRSFQGHGHIGRKDKPGKTVFVKILSLGPKQTFGLDHVVFDDVEKATNVSLVSDGAEAVLINRKFFISHLTDDVKKTIRSAIQPYPSESSLQQKLQNETNWEAFKSMTVNDHIHFSKYVHDTLHL